MGRVQSFLLSPLQLCVSVFSISEHRLSLHNENVVWVHSNLKRDWLLLKWVTSSQRGRVSAEPVSLASFPYFIVFRCVIHVSGSCSGCTPFFLSCSSPRTLWYAGPFISEGAGRRVRICCCLQPLLQCSLEFRHAQMPAFRGDLVALDVGHLQWKWNQV